MKSSNPRLLRITTVPISLKILLAGQLSFFKTKGFDVLAVSAEGIEVNDIRSEGIDHVVVPFTRKITPLQDLVCLFQLIRVIRRFRPDIVHTHTPKAGLIGMMAAWWCRVPVRLHTVAGLPLMETKGVMKWILTLAERVTYFCATGVYPNSHGLLDYIHRYISRNSKIKILGRGSTNGINTSFFNRTPELERQAAQIRTDKQIASDFVFSFVGRIVRDKGISELIQAFRTLREKASGIKIRLLLIGPFEQELDPLNENDYHFLQSDPDVILAGFQRDIRPWLLASDVFVFPSYREGFPNVVMQAACLQIPSVVSDINGCNEIIQHNVTGFIVPAKNAGELEQAMQKLYVDKTIRARFAVEASKFVSENFDQQMVWKELYKMYRDALTAYVVSNNH